MTRPWQIAFGLALTALAGYVDALGFIRLGGLYTSLMSGNTTQFAVAIGHDAPAHVVLPALLLLAFLIGAVTGGALSAMIATRWSTPCILVFEALAVSTAFVVARWNPQIVVASLFLALAMGVQNAVLVQVQGFRAGATFVTGALFSFGQKFAQALAGQGPRWGFVGDGLVWLALLVGALGGTLANARLADDALAIPALAAGTLALAAILLTVLDAPVRPAGARAAGSTPIRGSRA